MKGAKDSGAKAFVAWSYPPDSFGLAEQAIIEDLDVNLYYSAVATSFPAFKGAYGNKINNVLGAGGTNVDDPKIAEYRAAHKEITGEVADYWASANTYAALQILEQAIEGAGTLDRDVVTQYIKDNTFDTVMGTLNFENQVSTPTGRLVSGRMVSSVVSKAPMSMAPCLCAQSRVGPNKHDRNQHPAPTVPGATFAKRHTCLI